MKTFIAFGLIGLSCSSAFAIDCTAVMTFTPNGSKYDYDIALKNTGAGALVTLWYAWRPGQNYIAQAPTNVISPQNWNASVTHGGPTDGYGINFSTFSDQIVTGQTRHFKFTSNSTPGQLSGNSVFYPSIPVGTTWVYDASGASKEIVITAVPEPTSLIAVAIGAVAVCIRRRK